MDAASSNVLCGNEDVYDGNIRFAIGSDCVFNELVKGCERSGLLEVLFDRLDRLDRLERLERHWWDRFSGIMPNSLNVLNSLGNDVIFGKKQNNSGQLRKMLIVPIGNR